MENNATTIDRFIEENTPHRVSGWEEVKALVQAVARIPWGEARAIEEVLERNCGTCTGKHLLLQACLERIGHECRPVCCTFKWSEQQLDLPPDLRAILQEGDWKHGHNFLQIQSNTGPWIDIDVTWDTALKLHGFRSFPEDWDGQENFIGMLNISDRIDAADLLKKQEWLKALDKKTQERRERFLREFFQWVQSLRTAHR
jgi:hypothetical protein